LTKYYPFFSFFNKKYLVILEMPYGQLPVLEVEGVQLPQSNAIARFIASKNDLTGYTVWDSANCDQLVDAISDLMRHYGSIV
jgi:glutathione S-transferase